MEECPHVRQMSICQHKSLLNPRNWSCSDCGTTDGVWACLTCSHFACGRAASGHAIKHYHMTRHPLAMEVNEKYVHCYLCDDWVLNDTSTGDIQLIQSLLQQVAAQNYQESRTRSGRVIRPASLFMRMESRIEEAQSRTADKRYTAICHWKYLQLSRTFKSWRHFVQLAKLEKEQSSNVPTTPTSSSSSNFLSSVGRQKLITPGMTGLRNLGNTCYMNAALQALGHLQFLRETFRQMGQPTPTPPTRSDSNSSILFNRQTTIECFQHLSTKPPNKKTVVQKQEDNISGLSGGDGGETRRRTRETVTNEELSSLCEEIHRLMRVMWSGKWAVVTPHTVLTAIWHHIPTFRGYCQQDAQEFLCELLDRLQSELLQYPSQLTITITHPSRDVVTARELLPSLFEGQLSSMITYTKCRHTSFVHEPFWDLSLQFPEKHSNSQVSEVTTSRRTSTLSCTLKEMLEAFISIEHVEEEVFECNYCPGQHQSVSKQLTISHPPEILRLHLKRFRYSGRCWQKITTPIIFPMELDLLRYCKTTPPTNTVTDDVGVVICEEDYVYDLTSVIVHHGGGFNSGHYTAYCWNNEAGTWVHCNDARVIRCSPEDVLKSQAYVLFYARRTGRSPVLNRFNNTNNDRGIDEPPPCKISRRIE